MKTRLLAVAAAAALTASVGAFLPMPASAQQDFNTMSVTKIVEGDGPQTDYPFVLSCVDFTPVEPDGIPSADPGDFVLDNGETVVFDEEDLGVDFSAPDVGCYLTEDGTQGALDVDAVVIASDGSFVPVTKDDSKEGEVEFTFDTIAGEDLDYEILVFNTFANAAGDICPSYEQMGQDIMDILTSTSDDTPLSPEEMELLWTTYVDFFVDGLTVVPAEISDAWVTTTVAMIQIDEILAEVGYDVDLLTAEQEAEIDGIYSDSEEGIGPVVEWLGLTCPQPVPPSSTTTTSAAAAAAVTTPRYTG